MVWRLSLTLLFLLPCLPVRALQEEDPALATEINTPDWKIWLPAGLVRREPRGFVLHASNSDEASGWPLLDGVLEPMDLGITIVPDEASKDLEQLADNHERLFADPETHTRIHPAIRRDVDVPGGGRGLWSQTLVFDRQTKRITWVGKLFTRGPDRSIWIVTAFISCSEAGWPSVSRQRLPWVLARHVQSFTFDREQTVPQRLAAALRRPQATLAEGIRLTLQANRALKRGHARDARDLYRILLRTTPDIPFALMARSQCEVDLGMVDTETIDNARRAVDLTEGRWIPALDTHAAACRTSGRVDAARASLNRILGLRPADREYWLKRLETLDDTPKGAPR